MASTGNVFPGAAVNVDRAGNTAWTNPGNVVSDNATDATVVVPSDYLATSSYNFASIPNTARILGVTVRVEAAETGTGTSNYIPQLISDPAAPTLIGAAKSAVTVSGATPVISTNGGAADLWSATLTPAIVKAAGFGVAIWSADTVNTLLVDFVTIAVEWGETAPWLPRHDPGLFRRRPTKRWTLARAFVYAPAAPAASTSSVGQSEPKTRFLRGGTHITATWIAAMAPPVVAATPPSAWFAAPPPRRRATKRRSIVEEPLVFRPPAAAPAPASAWSQPAAARRARHERRKLEELETLSTAVAPPAPSADAVEDSQPVVRNVRGRTFVQSPPVPILAAPAPPAPVPFPAWLAIPTKRRKARPGAFLSAGDADAAAPQPPTAAWGAAPALRRRPTARYRLLMPFAPVFPVTPAAPQQPLAAWGTQPLRRRRAPKRQTLEAATPLFRAPQAPQPPVAAWAMDGPKRRSAARRRPLVQTFVFRPPPVVAPQPVAAWAQQPVKRRGAIARFPAAAPQLVRFPATPAAPAQPVEAWALQAPKHRAPAVRRQAPALELAVFPPTPPRPPQPYTAWTPVELVRRRHRRRIKRLVSELVGGVRYLIDDQAQIVLGPYDAVTVYSDGDTHYYTIARN